MQLNELVGYLDDYLRVREIPDHPRAFNGLQVFGSRDVTKAALAVDACRATVEAAVEHEADILIVHHGLFWGETAPLTGTLFHRLRPLMASGMALYSCHLPLDVHPEVGNNAVLCRLLGFTVSGTFGSSHGTDAGLIALGDTTGEALKRRLDELLGGTTRWIAGARDAIRRVAVLTGSGASYAEEAAALGCDALITGEGSHHAYLVAEESGIHVYLAGHYATETLGVRALGEHLQARLGLPCVFIDHPTGL